MTETVFTYGAPSLKFGPGSSAEIGYDLGQFDARRVLLVTDPGVAATGHPARIADQIRAAGIEVVVFDRAHVEPTDASLEEAVAFGRAEGPFDAYVAVGGGSAIDTAKATNLLGTNEGELLEYVNKPVGGGRAPSHPLKPLVAVPTTTGTGSESTTICVLDVLAQHVKTGISHPRLRPTLAVVDPLLTMTQPSMVTAASGMDILCHALESYTARWYAGFPAQKAEERVPYCGANFFFSSRRRHTIFDCDWSSDVCSSDLFLAVGLANVGPGLGAIDPAMDASARVLGARPRQVLRYIHLPMLRAPMLTAA